MSSGAASPVWPALFICLLFINRANRSLIGMSKSSAGETDALAEVTVLFEVDSESPHHGCQGRTAATCGAPFFPERIVGKSLLAVVSTRRPSQGSVSAGAELGGGLGIRP